MSSKKRRKKIKKLHNILNLPLDVKLKKIFKILTDPIKVNKDPAWDIPAALPKKFVEKIKFVDTKNRLVVEMQYNYHIAFHRLSIIADKRPAIQSYFKEPIDIELKITKQFSPTEYSHFMAADDFQF